MDSFLLSTIGLGVPEILVLLLGVGYFAFWIWMIVDCVTKEEGSGSKVAWLLVIILLGLIGAPLYFFVRKLPRKGKPLTPPAL